MENEVKVMYGWVCPRCGATNAPWMNQCNCHLNIGASCGGMDKREKNTELLESICAYGEGNVSHNTASVVSPSISNNPLYYPPGKRGTEAIIDNFINRR